MFTIEPKTKFGNQYRIESARLKNWDYSSNAVYFITICTKNREPFFGKILDSKMSYSSSGEIVAKEWENTRNIRINVKLDEWVIMPNHFHAIIIVETHCNASLQGQKKQINRFGPQSNNLAAIIRGFKGATTKQIHISGLKEFAWQDRFYDHIIRDEEELNRIQKYIQDNPVNWDKDKNNPKNLIEHRCYKNE